MNQFDFMTVASQLWGQVKYDEKEINDFGLGLDFALRPWGPSLKNPQKKEKINKVASSTYWISAHRCGNGAYDLYQTVFGFFGLVDVPEAASRLQGSSLVLSRF